MCIERQENLRKIGKNDISITEIVSKLVSCILILLKNYSISGINNIPLHAHQHPGILTKYLASITALICFLL